MIKEGYKLKNFKTIVDMDGIHEETFYRSSDSDDFPIGPFVIKKTGKPIDRFFKPSDDIIYDGRTILNLITKKGFIHIHTKEFQLKDKHYLSSHYYKKYTDGGIIVISFGGRHINDKRKGKNKETGGYPNVYSNTSEDTYRQLISELSLLGKPEKETANNIRLITTSKHGYGTVMFELPKQKMDIELNYGSHFTKVHNKIITHLNKPNGKGLVLLHGTPGTGKTHYLKYLASKIKDKKVIFVPPHLADFITSPEMTSFLIDHSDSVLFIEDAERVITDRNTGGTAGVSNILNITDGILSDMLNIQIVATFNMDKKKIDEALLRKGRLIAEHKFDKLSTEESNKLVHHLKIKDFVAIKPMTLTEIYNVNEEEFKSEEKTKIGFK